MRIYALLKPMLLEGFLRSDALRMQQKLLDLGYDSVKLEGTSDIAADEDQHDVVLRLECASNHRKSGKYKVAITAFAPGRNESAWSIPREDDICTFDEAFEVLKARYMKETK